MDQLLDIAKRVLAAGDVESALTTALDSLIEWCGAERGMILLFDDAGEVHFQSARHLGHRDIENPEFEVSRSVLERVRKTQRPFFHANVLDDPDLSVKASVLRLRLLSILCLPVRPHTDADAVGVIYLDQRGTQHRLDGRTLPLAESFAEFISLAAAGALERHRLAHQVDRLAQDLRQQHRFENIVGRDPALVATLQRVARVAASEVPVLIEGESGTGKELIARALHHNSRRQRGPFVALNCSALPEALLEAELFGHARGAFTGAVQARRGWFEEARGGTLFLDEIGEMPLAMQAKLLRVLESGEFTPLGSAAQRRADVRILAATHRELSTLIDEGRFRQDLFYRLKVVEVQVPPLRQRASDIPLLLRHFLEQARRDEAVTAREFSAEVQALLQRYRFPGNVRELRNLVQRAALLCSGERIEVEHLPETVIQDSGKAGAMHSDALLDLSFSEAKQRLLDDFERRYLTRALEASGGNVSQAARDACMDVKNLRAKLKRLGIDAMRFR